MTQIPIIERKKKMKYMAVLSLIGLIFSILTILLSDQIESLTQLSTKFFTLAFVSLMAIPLLLLNLMKNYFIIGKLMISKDDLNIQIASETIEKVKIVDLNINNYKVQNLSLLQSVRNFFPEENGMGNYFEVEMKDGKRKFEILIENEGIYKLLKRLKQSIKNEYA